MQRRQFLVYLLLLFVACSEGGKENQDSDILVDNNEIEQEVTGQDYIETSLDSWGEAQNINAVKSNDIEVKVTKNGCAISIVDSGHNIKINYGSPSIVLMKSKDKLKPDYYIDPYKPQYTLTEMKCEKVVGFKQVSEQEALFRLAFDNDTFAILKITIKSSSKVLFDLEPDKGDWQITGFRLVADKDENFYGLGEQFKHVALRGDRYAMQMELTGLESANNEAHFPIPLFISTRGYGVFVQSMLPGSFDMCKASDDTIAVDFEAKQLKWWVFLESKPIYVLQDYVDITGKPAVPATWAFAPHLWRNENKDQAEVIADAKAARKNNVPFSVIWIDNPWQHAYNDHIFDKTKFPDAKAMIRTLHDLGFRVVVWSTPYLQKEIGEDLYNEAKSKGYLVVKDPFKKFGDLVDLTFPDAVKFFQRFIKNATDIGVEGFKLDYAEDCVVGILKTSLNFEFHSGESNKIMHEKYQILYHKTYREMLGKDYFMIVRAGAFGDQVYTTAVWPGDLDNGFETFGQDKRYVGGLPSAVNGGLSLSVSGYPFYGSDVGGFRHGRPTKKAFIRWSEYAAFGTIMQVGGGGANHLPWDFKQYGNSKFDQETLAIFRAYAQLHTRLFPYIYTYAIYAHDTGRCVSCPVGFYFPELNKHPDFAFMLGDWILVEPVVSEDDKRHVVLPEGKWLATDGRIIEGPAEFNLDVPLSEVPWYLRAGAIVPMLEGDIQTLAPANKEIRSWANDPGSLIVYSWPDIGKSKLVLQPEGTAFSIQGRQNEVRVSMTGPKRYKSYIYQIVTSLVAPDATSCTIDGFTKTPGAITPGMCVDCYTCRLKDAQPTVYVQIGADKDSNFTIKLEK